MGIFRWCNYRGHIGIYLAIFVITLSPKSVTAKVITRFDTNIKEVALTFDACETKTASYFDEKILKYLIDNKIPATFFISGKFALRNSHRISEISKYDFFEIENHSFNHIQHMEKLTTSEISEEIMSTKELLKKITGKNTKFFRFPGGNYDKNTLDFVKKSGLKIVHWSFETGDPDKNMTPDKIIHTVKNRTKPGSILIFHINGRGYHTGEALPEIIDFLRSKNYKIVKLEDVIK